MKTEAGSNGHTINQLNNTDFLLFPDSPVFLTRPENAAGMPGERVTLRCKVDSNPKPLYAWYHILPSNQERLVGNSANLSIVVNENTMGEYICKTDVPGYTEITAKAQIFMKGPPEIRKSSRIQHATEGTDGKIVCEAFTVPSAEIVEWTFKGQILSVMTGKLSEKYSVLEQHSDQGVQSTLVVKDVKESDFGAYACTVSNAFGADTALIHLRRHSKCNKMRH